MNHPSRLALDRLALAQGAPPAELRSHVETCEACRAHLAAVQVELPRPAWLDGVASRPPRWRLPVIALAGALAASLVIVISLPRPDAVAKGNPALTVWIKHGEQVTPWSSGPVRAGDAVRLEVAPSGFSHVLVAQVPASGAPRVLYEARLERTRPTVLTPAWTVDAEGAEEHLAVLLSHHALADDEVTARLGRRDAEFWSFEYRLQKEHP